MSNILKIKDFSCLNKFILSYKFLIVSTLFVLSCIQSWYLYLQISNFRWFGCDDLITLTLVSNKSISELITALESGVNLFPPFYFFLAFFLLEILEIKKNVLLWIHIPMLWLSIFLCYSLFRTFLSSQLSLLSTVVIATIKSAFLTQCIYVRPYCLYYCAALATTFSVIKFLNYSNKSNFIIYWISFQILSLTHYYGLLFGLIISIPLLFIEFSFIKRFWLLVITLIPTIFVYSHFLPKQMNYMLFSGTTGGTSFYHIFNHYIVLSFSSLVLFLTITIISFIVSRKFNFSFKTKIPYSLFLLGVSPLLINFFLYLSYGEGTYYRYFIPAQVGIASIFVWLSITFIPLPSVKFSNTFTFVFSVLLIATWSLRNFHQNDNTNSNFYTGSMEFEYSSLLNSEIPFYTSHLPTFLKMIHHPDWNSQTNLLRTDDVDFIELPKFSKILSPSSLLDLLELKQFIYHYYYSGPHSNIDFKPKKWAFENGFNTTVLNHYPLVIRFNRI